MGEIFRDRPAGEDQWSWGWDRNGRGTGGGKIGRDGLGWAKIRGQDQLRGRKGRGRVGDEEGRDGWRLGGWVVEPVELRVGGMNGGEQGGRKGGRKGEDRRENQLRGKGSAGFGVRPEGSGQGVLEGREKG